MTKKGVSVIAAAVTTVAVLACGSGGDNDESPAPPPSAATTPAEPLETSAAPKRLTMPNVVNKNAAVAKDQLTRLGFTNIEMGSQDQFDTVVIIAANWTVAKQSTKAGAKVMSDELIVLTCTKVR